MGHTAIRQATVAMLKTHLPARITALRKERGVEFVPIPNAAVGYRLTDVIPRDDANPLILISSCTRTPQRREGPESTAPVTARYDLSVAARVLPSLTEDLDDEQASIARDLITDAIAECFRMFPKLADDISIDRDSGASECGMSIDLAKRAVAIGQVELSITATESITVPDPPQPNPTVTVGFLN